MKKIILLFFLAILNLLFGIVVKAEHGLAAGAACRSKEQGNLMGPWQIQVSPNPVRDKASLSFCADAEAEYQISILDLTGRLIQTKYNRSGPGVVREEFSFSEYNKGIYLVVMSAGTHRTTTRVVVE